MSSALFNRFRTARPVAGFAPRIGAGQHLLALSKFEMKSTSDRGDIFAAEFEVIESNRHEVGSIVSTAWFVSDPGWKGDKALGKAMVFVNQLTGARLDDNDHFDKSVKSLMDATQPGRGLLIRAFATAGKPSPQEVAKAAAENRVAEGFVEIVWSHVTGQTPEAKATRRAGMEARGIGTDVQPSPAPQAQATGALQPLPPGWPEGAPIPPGFYKPEVKQGTPLPPGWPADAPVPPGYYRT